LSEVLLGDLAAGMRLVGADSAMQFWKALWLEVATILARSVAEIGIRELPYWLYRPMGAKRAGANQRSKMVEMLTPPSISAASHWVSSGNDLNEI